MRSGGHDGEWGGHAPVTDGRCDEHDPREPGRGIGPQRQDLLCVVGGEAIAADEEREDNENAGAERGEDECAARRRGGFVVVDRGHR